MTDDVGTWNVSAYHRGMMGGRTPNIDRIASEGALFTDYYAQQSCNVAGRAGVHSGPDTIPHGSVEGGFARCQAKVLQDKDPTIARTSSNHVWLTCHGADWQEPLGRPQRIPADRSWLR